MWQSTLHIQVSGAGGEAAQTFTFHKRSVKIGTSHSADLRLEGAGLGSVHAVIRLVGDHAVLSDANMGAKVLSDGGAVSNVKLHDGDVIHLGDLELRIFLDDPPDNATSPSSESEPAPSFHVQTTESDAVPCPRCRFGLTSARWVTGGGYRDGQMFDYLRCDRCSVSIVTAETLQQRYGLDAGRLADSPQVRTSGRSDQPCPQCPAELRQVTLAEGETWVAVEECGSCGAIVMDDGEGSILDELLSPTRAPAT